MSRLYEFKEVTKDIPTGDKSYVRNRIARGFGSFRAVEIAEKRWQAKKQELNAKNIPSTIKELYSLYPDDSIKYPAHLKPYMDILEKAANGEQQRVCFHAPPQHQKTYNSLMALVYICISSKEKTSKNAYITYSTSQAKDKMREVVGILKNLGASFHTVDKYIYIAPFGSNKQTNSIYFAGQEAGITGKTFNSLVIVDDIIKDAYVANSKTQKDAIWEDFWTSIKTRKYGKMSIIVMATRWVNDDITQRLVDQGWPYIRLAAICDDSETDPLNRNIGEPLLPEIHPLEDLLEMKTTNEHKFSAMYQGVPLSDSMRIFKGITTYDTLPNMPRYMIAAGIDLAYSAGKNSDYSSICVVKYDITNNKYYLLDTYMRQCLYTEFIEVVQNVKSKYNLTTLRFDASHTEAYTSGEQLAKKVPGTIVKKIPPGYGKIQRSTLTSDLWNSGHLLVPEEQNDMMKKALACIQLFTGDGKSKDDPVDSLASAINAIHEAMAIKSYNKNLHVQTENNRRQPRKTRVFGRSSQKV